MGQAGNPSRHYASQISVLQIGPRQIGTGQNGIAEVGTAEVEPIQISATQVASMQIDLHPARGAIDTSSVSGSDGDNGDANQQ